MIILNIEQHSEAWHQARLGRVTGTRFKNLMSGFETASWKDLITDMACELITGRADEKFVSAVMEEGSEEEQYARMAYENEFETKVDQVGFIMPDESHQYHEWVGVSPDGLILPQRGLEIKCPLQRTHFEYMMANRLPAEYRHQVQGSLYVTGLPEWHFMSYVEGMKPFIIKVLPDEALFKQYEERLAILTDLVLKKLDMYHKYDYQL